MQAELDRINSIAEFWRNTKSPDPNQVLEAHRTLTGLLVYLEAQRSEFKKKYESIIFDKKCEGGSVASATNYAETQVPELYLLRRIMEAAYEMSGSMRTYISFLKHEKENP